MLVKLLVLNKNKALVENGKRDCFSDIQDIKFNQYICEALQKGIINGRGKSIYDPVTSVTRAEALKMVMNTYDIEIPKWIEKTSYTDVKVNDWFGVYVETAREK